MTPKERAKKLIDRFEKEVPTHHYNFGTWQAVVCVQIFCDELIQLMPSVYVTSDEEIHSGHRQYWEQVKKELESFQNLFSSHETDLQGADSGQLQQHGVMQRSELLVCPNCANPYPHGHTDGSKSCEECGHKWQTNSA